MKCGKCGNENAEELINCMQCGEVLEKAEEPKETVSDNKKPLKLKNIKNILFVAVLLVIGTVAAVYANKKVAENKVANAKTEAAQNTQAAVNNAKKPVSTTEKMNRNEVVVKIGEQEIKEPIFRIYFWITQQRFESAGPNIWEIESGGKKAEDIAKENTVADIKFGVAAKQKADELGIKLTDEENKAIYDQANDIMTNNVEMAEKLQINLEDMKEFITHGVYVQNMMMKIGEGYTPTEEELKTQMDAIKAKYETATVKHVLIKTVDDSGKELPADQLKAVETKANEVLKKALAGEDMAGLAKTYSEDPGSKDQGGEYTFPKGQMVPEFEEVAFTGEIGKVYPKLVKTSYGYHIMKVEKRDSGDAGQIKKESEQAAKVKYAQEELMRLSEKLTIKTMDRYNTISIIK